MVSTLAMLGALILLILAGLSAACFAIVLWNYCFELLLKVVGVKVIILEYIYNRRKFLAYMEEKDSPAKCLIPLPIIPNPLEQDFQLVKDYLDDQVPK